MNKTNKLSNVAVGDTLLYHDGGFSRRKSLVKIERLTRTQIITSNGKFNRQTGYETRKNSYESRGRVFVPIKGEVEKVRDENWTMNLCFKLENIKWNDLPIQTLREISALLP